MTKDLDLSVYREMSNSNLEQLLYLGDREAGDPAVDREMAKVRSVLVERGVAPS